MKHTHTQTCVCLTEYLSHTILCSKVASSKKKTCSCTHKVSAVEEGVGNLMKLHKGGNWHRNNQLTVEQRPARLRPLFNHSCQMQNVTPPLKKLNSRHTDHEVTVLRILKVNRFVLANFFCFVYFILFFVILTGTRVFGGKGTANEKITPPDWPVGKPVVCFPDWWLMLWAQLNRWSRKLWKSYGVQASKQRPSMASASVPGFRFLPWIPSLTFLDDDLQALRWKTPQPNFFVVIITIETQDLSFTIDGTYGKIKTQEKTHCYLLYLTLWRWPKLVAC